MKIHDVQQGSPAWFKLRSGVPTASEFDSIITPKTMQPSASRFKYAVRLICERLLNWQPISLDTVRHIEEGRLKEPQAVQQLEFTTGIETKPVGFITTDDGRFGASPDRLASSGAVTIEVKCPAVPTQMQYLLLGHDDAYRAQVQGQLHIAEADKAIFFSYHERMPQHLVETGRDAAFQAKLGDVLNRFWDEYQELTERARRLGAFQAYAEVKPPTDVAFPEAMSPAELDAFLAGDTIGTGRIEA